MERVVCAMYNIAVLAGVLACASCKSAATGASAAAAASIAGAGSAAVATRSALPIPTLSDREPRDYPGIQNAVAYHDRLVSGSVPEGDEGFETLAAMGVKTIISVDGAEPEVERARARGIQYIHLPIGYNGFDEQRKHQLTRATRDAIRSGAVYVHCHHGKHRSAAAAATVAVSLGWLTAEQATERMRVSGTAQNYKGLYACASAATLLDPGAIDRVPADFPSVWKPSGYVRGMVEIDEVFEHLKLIELAGWVTPPDHPDLVPAAEARRLAALFHQLTDTDYVARKPPDLAIMMREADVCAQGLENLLAGGATGRSELAAQFKLVGASCKNCHAKYRD